MPAANSCICKSMADKIERLVYQRFYKRQVKVFALLAFAMTVLMSLFWILGDNDNVVVLKAVSFGLTAFVWIGFLFFILVYMEKKKVKGMGDQDNSESVTRSRASGGRLR